MLGDPAWQKYPFGCGSKSMGSHFGVGAPLILEPILVGIGMLTGSTIRILTHGHLDVFPRVHSHSLHPSFS